MAEPCDSEHSNDTSKLGSRSSRTLNVLKDKTKGATNEPVSNEDEVPTDGGLPRDREEVAGEPGTTGQGNQQPPATDIGLRGGTEGEGDTGVAAGGVPEQLPGTNRRTGRTEPGRRPVRSGDRVGGKEGGSVAIRYERQEKVTEEEVEAQEGEILRRVQAALQGKSGQRKQGTRQPEVTPPSEAKTPPEIEPELKVEDIAGASDSDIDALLDEELGVKDLAKKAGGEAAAAVENAFKGLSTLFTPKNTLSSGPVSFGPAPSSAIMVWQLIPCQGNHRPLPQKCTISAPAR